MLFSPAAQTETRTVSAVSPQKAVHWYTLGRRFSLLKPLLHAQYGSVPSIIAADKTARVEVRVSTTGLSIRGVGKIERSSSRSDGGEVE